MPCAWIRNTLRRGGPWRTIIKRRQPDSKTEISSPLLEIFMRATPLLWIGGLGLLVSGCSGSKGVGTASLAPPPLNKDLLVGKWKNPIDNPAVQFNLRYEFAGDGTLKRTFA